VSYVFCECGARFNNDGEFRLHFENVHEAPRLRQEIERLRAAIKSEAEQHALNPETGLPALYPCDCRICLIAREGR